MNSRYAWCRSIACLFALAWFGSLAQGAESPADNAVEIAGVQVGIGNQYKVGHWTPVLVTLEGPADRSISGRLVLTTVDVDGLSTRYVDPKQTTVDVKGATSIWRYVKFGHTGGNLQVAFTPDDSTTPVKRVFTAADFSEGLPSTSELLVTLGGDVGIEAALGLRSRQAKRVTTTAKVSSIAELPDRPAGYAAINTLVLSTSGIDFATAPAAQLPALREWVLLGGRLILLVGKQGEAVLGESGALAALAPGKFVRVTQQRRSAAWEAFVGANQRLDTANLGARFNYDMTLLENVRGRVEVFETGQGGEAQPLVINYPVGFGQVTLVTCDLDREPFVSWRGRPRLMLRLLAIHEAGETGKVQDKEAAIPSQLGFTDLAGQLRTALDQYSTVTLVAFSWVAALVVIYILLIGPGDYFFGKLVVRRMQTTWLTLPLVTLGFVGLAWWLNTRLKSPDIQINQADVVDFDLASGVARGASWTHVYSPHTTAYTFQPQIAPPTFPAGESTTRSELSQAGAVSAWQGLPGVGLGGLDGRPAPNLFDSPYDVDLAGLSSKPSAPARVAGIPITSAATKSFLTTWWQPCPVQANKLVATRDGLLSGEFAYDLDVELEDCALLYENWFYRIPGKLGPGETVRINELSSPRNLHWQLTKKKTIDSKDVVTPWNVTSVETNRILEIMLFHKAAGGNNYTGLTNRYYLGLDLSDHLRTGRAILFGKAKQRPLTWRQADTTTDDAYDQSITYYRVVLPVGSPEPVAPR